MSDSENKLCPSSTCTEGAILLGVVQNDKKVALLNTQLIIDEEFVKTANKVGSPEKRFRFANKCVKQGCKQWTSSRCGVMDLLTEANKEVHIETPVTLKSCVIRENCRWFHQAGKRACDICTFIVTNNMEGDESIVVPMPDGLC